MYAVLFLNVISTKETKRSEKKDKPRKETAKGKTKKEEKSTRARPYKRRELRDVLYKKDSGRWLRGATSVEVHSYNAERKATSIS